MSIQDEIERLVAEERLFCLESLLTGDETVRTLWVSREILEALTTPCPADRVEILSEFRLFLDGFLEGGEFSVAEDPDRKPNDAQIARVHRVEDEFWDFRVTAPEPGIRAFGAFASRDTFILLTWEYREEIEIGDFDSAVARCKDEWVKHFNGVTPFRGRTLDDYLSNYYPV